MAVKECPACKGDTKCDSCRGTGRMSSPSFLSLSQVRCQKCKGNGNCTRCRGRGVVPDR